MIYARGERTRGRAGERVNEGRVALNHTRIAIYKITLDGTISMRARRNAPARKSRAVLAQFARYASQSGGSYRVAARAWDV